MYKLKLLTCYVLSHTPLGMQINKLVHLYRSLIRSKLDYGCIVYGSARGSYLQMLDSIQNYALRLCLDAYRTSPSSSLCVLANKPPLYTRRRKLSIQYCLKLSSSPQNPTHNTVFNCKFKDLFEREPNPTYLNIEEHQKIRKLQKKRIKVRTDDLFTFRK